MSGDKGWGENNKREAPQKLEVRVGVSLKPPFQKNGHRSQELRGSGVGAGGLFLCKGGGLEMMPACSLLGSMGLELGLGQPEVGLGVVKAPEVGGSGRGSRGARTL